MCVGRLTCSPAGALRAGWIALARCDIGASAKQLDAVKVAAAGSSAAHKHFMPTAELLFGFTGTPKREIESKIQSKSFLETSRNLNTRRANRTQPVKRFRGRNAHVGFRSCGFETIRSELNFKNIRGPNSMRLTSANWNVIRAWTKKPRKARSLRGFSSFRLKLRSCQ
jgi:hypothetical protein